MNAVDAQLAAAPIGEIVILLVIVGVMMLMEKSVGPDRFWGGLGKLALIGLIFIVLYGLAIEMTGAVP